MRWIIITTAAVLLVAGAGPGVARAKTIYVDADAAGADDGTNWADAYRFLQDALTDANDSEKPVEIHVAQGVYTPDRSAADPNGTGDREATFGLISGVALRGGYAGFGEPDPNTRDIELYQTILSGDLDGNDVEVNDVGDLWDTSRAENSYHVIRASGLDETAVLDGLTITGGNADGSRPDYQDRGGGIYNVDSSVTVGDCRFVGNFASWTGGGGMCNSGGSPILRQCSFSINVGNDGGGMYNAGGSPKLLGCSFVNNAAMPKHCSGGCPGQNGGALYNINSSPTLVNCTLQENHAGYGGGMTNVGSDVSLTNCLLVANLAGYAGGAIEHSLANLAGYYEEGSITLENCTLAGNFTRKGNSKGILVYDVPPEYTFDAITAVNCIFADGPNEIGGTYDITDIAMSYSNIHGGWAGEGNTDVDPWFARAGYWEDPCNTADNLGDDIWIGGDYHLKSQGGRWDPTEGRWLTDEVTSLCIDAGDPISRIGLESFPNGGVVNMGAYGGTAEASKSYFGEPVCETIVAGDVNGDCRVDFLDFQLMALHWLEET